MDRVWFEPEKRKPLTKKQIVELALRQQGRCPNCTQKLQIKGGLPVEIIDEHVHPLWRSGSNDLSNRELWCIPCAKVKTAGEATDRAKSNRIRAKALGAHKSRSPMAFGRGSRLKRKMNGDIVIRDTGEIIR